MRAAGGGCEVFMYGFYSEEYFYAVGVEQNAVCEKGIILLTRKIKFNALTQKVKVVERKEALGLRQVTGSNRLSSGEDGRALKRDQK